MRKLLLFALLLLPCTLWGQDSSNTVLLSNGTPTGACPARKLNVDYLNSLLYFCSNSVWVLTTGGSGGTPAFSAITAGTNTNALLVGTAGTFGPTGTGIISSTSIYRGGIYANDYGAKADGQVIYDATTTNGSATITCPNSNCNFTAADVGKIVFATSLTATSATPFQPTVICGQSTIATVNNAQSITMTAGTCSSSKTATATLVWGSDDTTALANAWTAVTAVCGVLNLPFGRSLIQSAVFLNAPTKCKNHSFNSSQQLSIVGLGYRGGSEIVPTPSFNYATCTGPDTTGTACFGWGTLLTTQDGGMYLKNWTINAYGQSNPVGSTAEHVWLYVPADTLIDGLTIANWGSNATHVSGVYVNGNNANIINSVFDGAGCGSASTVFNTFNGGVMVVGNGSTAELELVGNYLGDTNCESLVMAGTNSTGPNVKSSHNEFGPSSAASQAAVVTYGAGTIFESTNDTCYMGANTGGSCLYVHGGLAKIDHWTSSKVYGGIANQYGLYADAGTVIIRDSEFFGVSHEAVTAASGSCVINAGGNLFSSASGSINVPSGGKYMDLVPSTYVGATALGGTLVAMGSVAGSASKVVNSASCALAQF